MQQQQVRTAPWNTSATRSPDDRRRVPVIEVHVVINRPVSIEDILAMLQIDLTQTKVVPLSSVQFMGHDEGENLCPMGGLFCQGGCVKQKLRNRSGGDFNVGDFVRRDNFYSL